jgi:hypothetical protein
VAFLLNRHCRKVQSGIGSVSPLRGGHSGVVTLNFENCGHFVF